MGRALAGRPQQSQAPRLACYCRWQMCKFGQPSLNVGCIRVMLRAPLQNLQALTELEKRNRATTNVQNWVSGVFRRPSLFELQHLSFWAGGESVRVKL